MVNLYKPIWSNLKMKEKRPLREKCYTDVIMQSITTMFKYKHNVDDETFKRAVHSRLEEMLRLFGKLAFFKDGDRLMFGTFHFVDTKNELDWAGTCNGITITTMNGKVYERTIGVDAVIMCNNNLMQSELNIFRYVEQLAEVDISQIDILINARSHPIIVAKTDKDAEIIRKAIQDNKDGTPLTVACSGNISKSALTGISSEIEVLTVTDPQTATLFQYYSHYHLDLTGRLYGLYGLSTFNTGKMAQTNDLEVSGTLASSMVIPMNNYECRKRACEDIQKLFGIEFDVEFGDCWKNQLAIMQGINKEEYNVEELEEANENELDEANDVKENNNDGENVED